MSTPADAPGSKGKRRLGRILLRWAVRAAIVYVGLVVVMVLLENWLVYHPTRAAQRWQPPPNDRVQDVELRAADGTALHAWWCPTDGWAPADGAVLFCPGNAGNLSDRGGAVAGWQRGPMRQAVLIFDYPGYGRSAGRPSEAGCCAAADAAYDWLTGVRQVPPERVLLFGESLGGGVAVDLASRRPHRALVVVKTFTALPDVAAHLYPWIPVRWLMRNRYDNLAKIGRCRGPVFVAHGTADGLVPFVQGERLFAAAAEPKRFLRLEGDDHNDPLPPEFDAALKRFLEEVEAGGR
jgi:hypothetical protein